MYIDARTFGKHIAKFNNIFACVRLSSRFTQKKSARLENNKYEIYISLHGLVYVCVKIIEKKTCKKNC